MITFNFKDAQRRADKQAGTPNGSHLERLRPFAKPPFRGFPRENGWYQAPAANNDDGSTFTPGPIVDEIATRLM